MGRMRQTLGIVRKRKSEGIKSQKKGHANKFWNFETIKYLDFGDVQKFKKEHKGNFN